jgi:hypothetical protein
MNPEVKDTSRGGYEAADLLAIAKVLSDAGLALTPFKDYETFEQRVRKELERTGESAESAAEKGE